MLVLLRASDGEAIDRWRWTDIKYEETFCSGAVLWYRESITLYNLASPSTLVLARVIGTVLPLIHYYRRHNNFPAQDKDVCVATRK